MKFLYTSKTEIRTKILYWVSIFVIGSWVTLAQGGEISYSYVSLGVSRGINLFWLTDNGKIYGNAFDCADVDCTTLVMQIATYDKGVLTLKPIKDGNSVSAVNKRGIVSGSVIIDQENFFTQAALFQNGTVNPISPLPGETSGAALTLNDEGTVLLQSQSLEGITYAFYKNRKTSLLNVDLNLVSLDRLHINNNNVFSGTAQVLQGQNPSLNRAFRYNPDTDSTTILNPLSTEANSWGMDLNDKGNVLGYSFNPSSTERIGVWDKTGRFNTYFVEGTPEFPTISNNLLFNNEGLIVITAVSNPPAERNLSYIVPKPGKRLNLADLVVNLPVAHSREFVIRDMNNRGDLFGIDRQGYVLLKRLDD
jgi:hypothetical protein